MEFEILQGCQETLKKTCQVVMETHSRRLHDETIEYLRRAEFRIDSEEFVGTTGLVFASGWKERRQADAPGAKAREGT